TGCAHSGIEAKAPASSGSGNHAALDHFHQQHWIWNFFTWQGLRAVVEYLKSRQLWQQLYQICARTDPALPDLVLWNIVTAIGDAESHALNMLLRRGEAAEDHDDVVRFSCSCQQLGNGSCAQCGFKGVVLDPRDRLLELKATVLPCSGIRLLKAHSELCDQFTRIGIRVEPGQTMLFKHRPADGTIACAVDPSQDENEGPGGTLSRGTALEPP